MPRLTGYAMRSAISAAKPVGIPVLWQQTFETAIIERYRRRESSVGSVQSFSETIRPRPRK